MKYDQQKSHFTSIWLLPQPQLTWLYQFFEGLREDGLEVRTFNFVPTGPVHWAGDDGPAIKKSGLYRAKSSD